jgi:hypothetical protein
MEGGSGKVIYLFGEIHESNPSEDRECPVNVASIRIDQLLKKIFTKRSHRTFDLFVETSESVFKHNYFKNVATSIQVYMEKMVSFASHNTSFTQDNRIIRSTAYPNVRFHYFDVRPDQPSISEIIRSPFVPTVNVDVMRRQSDNLVRIQKLLLSASNEIMEDPRFKKIQAIPKLNDVFKECIQFIQGLQNKIPKVRSKIRTMIIRYENDKKKFLSMTETMTTHIVPMMETLIEVYEAIEDVFVVLTDLFLVRRIAEKSYTKRCMVYCGFTHLVDVVNLLHHFYGYRITHTSGEDSTKDEVLMAKYTVDSFIRENYNLMVRAINTDFNYENHTPCISLAEFPPLLR